MPAASEGFAIARARIIQEQAERSGVLDLGNLGLLELPNELWELSHLSCLNLGVGWTDERNGFHFAGAGLSHAPNVLFPADVRSLWERLPELRILSLAGPRGEGSSWGDLRGLENLRQLRVLDLSWTEAADLAPLAGMVHLEVLDVSYTFVSSIAPLAPLRALRHLDLNHTQVADLSPLKGHAALETLLCCKAPAVSVVPLANLPALRKLDLTQTLVKSLEPLTSLPALQTLHCAWAPVDSLPVSLVRLPSLQVLVLHDTSITDVPVELMSPDGATSCLEALRTHFLTRGSWP
jgi:Leucine-rich repeat (LRR) protein